MKFIIQQTMQNMLEEVMQAALDAKLNLEELTPKVQGIALKATTRVIQELIMETDKEIVKAKKQRQQEGWVVERHGDTRTVTTQIGIINYHRTYYHNNKTGEYRYLIDQIVGVSPYMRVETGLSKQLVRESRHESYQLASEHSCDGLVSKQTVMNKIRKAKPVIDVPKEKRHVPELHIDADEDHVAMQDKRYKNGAIVPLISVYEGVEEYNNRRCCKNVFHMSAFKQDPDALWEEVLSRIEQRYDLTDTRIYLHGDGASWITKGMEWLPSATFVLDMYHKNKYVKQLLAGYDEDRRPQLRKDLNQALEDMDEDYFDNIVQFLVDHSPEREAKIHHAAAYLRKHMPDIAIRTTDPAACNGGATEPHVSHILSARLSSRPKGWSAKTLQFFVPILANGSNVSMEGDEPDAAQPVALKAMQKARHSLARHRTGSTCQSSLVITQNGKRTELYKVLQGLALGHMH